jgi:hypothetical protein
MTSPWEFEIFMSATPTMSFTWITSRDYGFS